MKKFLIICVAMIAFLATNASGGNQYRTDELRTCLVDMPSPPTFSLMAINVEPATAVYFITARKAEVPTLLQMYLTDGWRAPRWMPSLAINRYNFKLSLSNSNTVLQTYTDNKENSFIQPDNYNINYSYGLRF